jgi:dienelactone hydrolase
MSNIKEQWEHRFYDRTILWMNPALNAPHRAILVLNSSGKFQLHSHDFVTKFSYQLTKKSQGTLFGSISPNGEYVFYLNDIKGGEYGHFMRVPFWGGHAIDITPSLPQYYSYEVSVNNTGNLLCFYASIENKNKVYLVPFDLKEKPLAPRLLYESTKSIQGSIISPDGKFTCISLSFSGTKTISEVLIFDNITGNIIYKSNIKGLYTPHVFSKKLSELEILGLSNASGSYRPVLFYPKKKTVREIKNYFFEGEIFVVGWIEDEQKLLLCDVYQAKQRLLLYDLKKHNTKRIGPTSGTFDLFFNSVVILPDKSLLVRWHSFETSPQILKLHYPSYKKITNVYLPVSTTKTNSKFESISFRSSDGKKVQMWIAKPKNNKRKSPFIIDIHGGPHGVVGDEFSSKAQAWLDKGFGYCAVNYRGSIGFGKEFAEDIYGNPGKWEVEDIVAAHNWLVKKGLADSKRIILSGWSWGGYVVLLALGKYPDLWAGGIAGTPIADCVLQYEDEPAFFQALDQKRFGGTPAEVPNTYKKSSPITYAKDFQSPILILHGKNDVRCPPRQITRFEKTLKKEGKQIIVKRFSSGHAGEFANTKIRVSNIKAALDFAMNIISKAPPKKQL